MARGIFLASSTGTPAPKRPLVVHRSKLAICFACAATLWLFPWENVVWTIQTTPLLTTSWRETFLRVWPQMEESLCPRMVPKTAVGEVLFDLAWAEITRDRGGGNGNETATRRKKPSVVDTFFSGDIFGVATYAPPSKSETLIYLTIWKCGNNAIRTWMKHSIHEKYPGGEFHTAAELEDMESYYTTPLCIITAVRDPISHFLSGYNEIEFRNIVDYHDWTANATKEQNKYSQLPKNSTERFTQFIVDILQGGPEMTFWEMDMRHVYPMMRILEPISNLKGKVSNQTLHVAAYLNSTSNLSQTWPAFAAKSCPHSLPANYTVQPIPPDFGVHNSSKDPYGFYRAAKETWKEQGPAARALCILHVLDYACWRELEIPKLCQEVFSTKSFVESILP
mmetsp:Transcript_2451/g.3588  ORF Transcript_2451/g.3588 Transcript_2451/m.3588 type:complete len:394 (+) Transcript_2451:209-1390(+)